MRVMAGDTADAVLCLQALGSGSRPGRGAAAADAAPSMGAALLDAVTAFPGLADEDDKYQVPALNIN